MERRPNPAQNPLSEKLLKSPKLHRKGHPERSTYHLRTTFRVPFAVKFLEFLEPSPKEGSKRGLGQRPKVSPHKFSKIQRAAFIPAMQPHSQFSIPSNSMET